MIFDIKRYAIHDGPGIRTTVFFKGCPLHCPWCHNPEGIAANPQIMWWSERCLGCRDCVDACTEGAISFRNEELVLDEARCNMCGRCAAVCPPHALQVVGKKMAVDEVIKVIEKDITFYDESSGGVTFSGGEPLMQPELLHDILRRCKQRKIQTVVDTSGYAESNMLLRISDDVDLFLYDLKIIDDAKHKLYTGVSNSLILENLRMLADHDVRIVTRLSLIPGVNDGEDNIGDLGAFVASLKNVREVHILPYHRAGLHKLRRLRTGTKPFVTDPPSAEAVRSAQHQLREFGLRVQIGG